MKISFSWTGRSKSERMLARLHNPDATELMETWERILVEDNRAGVLSGLDADGLPLVPTKYRTSQPIPTKPRSGGMQGVASGTAKTSTSANLSSSKYRKLTGPPLAPRGEESRTIANFVTSYIRSGTRWIAIAVWDSVISKTGIPFLKYHFDGSGNNPRRNLAGIRAWGRKAAQSALEKWAKGMLK